MSASALVVVIGASAGGLDALQQVFRSLPDDSSLAFLVAQHLSPDFKSLMPELLARTTTMPLAVRNDHTGATVRAVDDVNHITALVHRVARGCRDADHRHQSANSRMSPRRRYW